MNVLIIHLRRHAAVHKKQVPRQPSRAQANDNSENHFDGCQEVWSIHVLASTMTVNCRHYAFALLLLQVPLPEMETASSLPVFALP